MISRKESPTNGPSGGSTLDGISLRPLVSNPDTRGEFIEVFSDRWDTGIEPAQWSIVHLRPGVLRGMHLHLRHEEYFTVVSGRANVGLTTSGRTRRLKGSGRSTCSRATSRCASRPPPERSTAGCSTEPTIHLQAVSEPYELDAADDNLGCHWSDPDLGIPWPIEPTIVSEHAVLPIAR